ncbi:pyridoxamine 5'-phosphate oxidase-domain-containing protein [Cladorrhinum sp. PSN259]|nr:pyridoxamine 5'-phosphate oxidase-domain-containing protein [Cladorrhinum sp. PSN259]
MSKRLSHIFKLTAKVTNYSLIQSLLTSTPPFPYLTPHYNSHHTLKMSSAQEEAPWRAAFLSHISQLKPPTFALATLHPSPTGQGPSPSSLPRVRTCVLRGLFASLPPNKLNPAPQNPPTYQSDFPVFTTDIRMEKLPELQHSSQVEAVWWVEASKTQWRIRGTAHVLSQDTFTDVLKPRVRKVREGSEEEEWDVVKEITAHFGNLNPVMRGSFKGPPPGRPIAEGDDGLKVGEKVEDLNDEAARSNFRVVVIVPEEVDQVLLEEVPRRWVYVYRGERGKAEYKGGEMAGESGWERCEVWP